MFPQGLNWSVLLQPVNWEELCWALWDPTVAVLHVSMSCNIPQRHNTTAARGGTCWLIMSHTDVQMMIQGHSFGHECLDNEHHISMVMKFEK